MNLFKYIGLGLSSVASLGSSRVREFIGLSSPILSEEDRQWQFLYKLSKKLFNSLKSSNKSSLSKSQKDNVIKWLKDKFKGSLENEEDKWENFKFLCEEQKSKEIKPEKSVDNDYSRLCFIEWRGRF